MRVPGGAITPDAWKEVSVQTCPRCGEAMTTSSSRPGLRCSAEVYAALGPTLARKKQERFLVVAHDARNRIIAKHLVALGSLAACVVHPREVFAPLIRDRAAAAILVHCHPSGDPLPSPDDIVLTERLAKAGQMLGIAVLDHLVVGREGYYSFRDSGKIE
jgi:DNA repair protein RadC